MNNQYPVGYNPMYAFPGQANQGQQPSPPPSAPPAPSEPDAFVPPPPPYHGVAQGYYAPPQQAQRVLTQAVHNQTLALLGKADEQANAILRRSNLNVTPYNTYVAQYPAYRRPVVAAAPVNITYVDNSWSWGRGWGGGWSRPQPQVVHHHHYQGNQAGNHPNQKKSDDAGLRILVGVVAAVVLGVGAYCLGKAVAANEDAQERTETYAELKHSWIHNKFCYPADYQVTVNGIVQRADSILQRQQTNRMHRTIFIIAALVAGGLAFAGAVAGSGGLMAAGTYVGGATLLLGLFKLGYNAFSNKERNDAQAIDHGIDTLRRQPNLYIYA